MEKISEYLKNNILITDGAMGTYYRSLSKKDFEYAELANIQDSEGILDIHSRYIQAGAKLIRTNTFNANNNILGSWDMVKKVITSGYKIAQKAAENKDVYVAADIGPIADCEPEEYKTLVNIFLSLGADIFVFETFNNYETLLSTAEYIKSRNKDAFVLTQFALNDTGFTKKAVSAQSIAAAVQECEYIDAYGFNCGVGPTHMMNILRNNAFSSKLVSALPNAGYPEVIDDKVEYVMNPVYFARIASKFPELGLKIIGGCCGTTPEHIALLSKYVSVSSYKKSKAGTAKSTAFTDVKANQTNSESKLTSEKFTVLVELEPPFKPDASKLLETAAALKMNGIELVTIADSPMGRARADSLMTSAQLQRIVGIDTLAHLCCRDRNSIALRSAVLGAYIEGIRNILAVTGDPVQNELLPSVKSVFNLNSYQLIKMLMEMNRTFFAEDPIKIGAAVNFNITNKDNEHSRLMKKYECGASFFLTQPLFEDDAIAYLQEKRSEYKGKFKLFGGIMPLVTYANAQFINNELPGINIPDYYVERFDADMSREESENIGIEIAVELIKKITPYVDGLYITAPFNRYKMVLKILKKCNLILSK